MSRATKERSPGRECPICGHRIRQAKRRKSYKAKARCACCGWSPAMTKAR